jgi:hypothetical protein
MKEFYFIIAKIENKRYLMINELFQYVDDTKIVTPEI